MDRSEQLLYETKTIGVNGPGGVIGYGYSTPRRSSHFWLGVKLPEGDHRRSLVLCSLGSEG